MSHRDSGDQVKSWTVEIEIDEHENKTRAKARLEWRGRDFVGIGVARRNPADYNVSEIGDELAAARALSDLGHQLLVVTASDIQAVTHEPVTNLHRTGASMTRATRSAPRAPRRVFHDRRDAGRVLAELLTAYRGNDDVIVLGLPRGGVPVAYEVATALGAPLDVFVVRKLGVPGHEELAMGAIASGGAVVHNDDVVRGLRITPQQLRDVAEAKARELLRREAGIGGRPPVDVAGKTVHPRRRRARHRRQHAGRRAGAARLQPARDRGRRARRPGVHLPGTGRPGRRGRVRDDPVAVLRGRRSPSGTSARPPTTRSATCCLRRRPRDRRPLAAPTRAVLRSRVAGTRPMTACRPSGTARAGRRRPLRAARRGSHGTHEFYEARAAMTRWLIEEKGFCAVAAEADWPDAYRVNRYVRARSDDATAEEALRGFERFPTWMWRNAVVLDFVGWLREHNDRVARRAGQAGFYGLDLYSLYRSMEEVITYLDTGRPACRRPRP